MIIGIQSLFYLITYSILFYALYTFPKSNKKLNGFNWLIIIVVLIFWINALFAGVMDIVHIPINIVTIGICYIFISFFLIKKKKYSQEYLYPIKDLFAYSVIIIISVGLCLLIHHYNLQISYRTSDPSMHLKYAMQFMKTHSIKGLMYYAPLNNGLIMEFFRVIVSGEKQYKVFILLDCIMFMLSGFVFYGLLENKQFKNKFSYISRISISVLYLLGYPLTNKIFGFVYLGMCVSIINVLIYLLKLYLSKEINEKLALIFIMLGLNGIVMCYMLFAPTVYIAVFILMVLENRENLFSKQFIIKCIKLFLLPCILGVYYCYFQFFRLGGITIGGAIDANGAIYSNDYSNFILFAPLIVYALICSVKNKEEKELITFFMCFVFTMCVMIVLIVISKASFYYFYKFHFVFWLLYCWISYIGINNLYLSDCKIVYSFVIVIACLALCWITNFNTYWYNKKAEFQYAGYNENYYDISFDVYGFNLIMLKKMETFDPGKLQLYSYICNEIKNKDNVIPLFVEAQYYEDWYWYEDITNQDMKDYYLQFKTDEEVADMIFNQKKVKYIVVFNKSEVYSKYKKMLKNYKTLYKNKYGKVIEIE